jgi:hypothetical protein
MARIFDVVLIAISLGGCAAMTLYKLILMFRYRNDREKLEWLVWTNQVFPKRLHRFMYDEVAGKAEGMPPHHPRP